MDAKGKVSQVAAVELPDVPIPADAPDPRVLLDRFGLRVTGSIRTDEVRGDTLVVDEVIAAIGQGAPFANGTLCNHFPCATMTVALDSGEHEKIIDLDFSMLDLNDGEDEQILADALEGKLVFGGFVRQRETGARGPVFVPTQFGELNEDYEVAFRTCITPEPCLIAFDTMEEGHRLDEVNLDALELSDARLAAAMALLEDSALDARGFISRPAAEGVASRGILHVTKILSALK
jgi:hypothetical protein